MHRKKKFGERKTGREFPREPGQWPEPVDTPHQLQQILRYCHEPETREKALKRLEGMAEILDEDVSMELLRLSQNRKAVEIAIGKISRADPLIHRFRNNQNAIGQWNSQAHYWGEDEESARMISELGEVNRAIIRRLGSLVEKDSWAEAARAVYMVIDYSDEAGDISKALGRLLMLGEEEPLQALDIISAKTESVIAAVEKVRSWDAFEGMAALSRLDNLVAQSPDVRLGRIVSYLNENRPSLD